MSTVGWIVLGVANVPVYFGLGWVFFSTWSGFFEALRYTGQTKLRSTLQGEMEDYSWAILRLALWVACCAGCVYGEAKLIEKVFG